MKYLLAVVLLIVSALPSQALGVCGKREVFLKSLAQVYQETRRSFGITNNVNLVEFFASKKGTWTLLVTTPSGLTCVYAAGDQWEDVPPEKPKGTDL